MEHEILTSKVHETGDYCAVKEDKGTHVFAILESKIAMAVAKRRTLLDRHRRRTDRRVGGIEGSIVFRVGKASERTVPSVLCKYGTYIVKKQLDA